MNTPNISQVHDCAYCGACKSVCPAGAIRMDGSGVFYRMQVDADRCVGCGRCLQVCPMENPIPPRKPVSAFGGAHQDREILRSSSSGGAFTALAEQILSQGGVVFGAAFSGDFRRVEIRSTEEVPLQALRRSKYVESIVDDAFLKAEAYLQTGRPVLFCGTPCQAAGLRSYLGRDEAKLYIVDFACGGLPSHAVYEAYLDELTRRYGEIRDVNFRPKLLGWDSYSVLIHAGEKRYHAATKQDPYLYAFLDKHVSIRDNCCSCRFAQAHAADITLADFWLHRQFVGFETPNHTGLSLLHAYTPRGEALIRSVQDTLCLQALDVSQASYHLKPSGLSEAQTALRAVYFREFSETSDARAAALRIGMPTGAQAVKQQMNKIAKGWLKGFR